MNKVLAVRCLAVAFLALLGPLPFLLAHRVSEMWNGANLSFCLGPMLTSGAVHAVDCDDIAAMAVWGWIADGVAEECMLTVTQSPLGAVRSSD